MPSAFRSCLPVLLLVACGGAPPAKVEAAKRESAPAPVAKAVTPEPPAPSEPAPLAEAAAPSESTTREIPAKCAGTDGCFPDPAFAERVCRGKFPDLPLVLFAKGTPWQHLYVKAESVEPVNAYGGERSESLMRFGEEVVVLHRHGPPKGKGVQISGPTDLDVLRWDGTCATIREEMFVPYVTGEMVSPRIVWKYLDDPLKDRLRQNALVDFSAGIERRDCKGVSRTHPTPACDKAMKKLTDAIVIVVHMGIELPPLDHAPEWQPTQETAAR
jgi:hypothetical protein